MTATVDEVLTTVTRGGFRLLNMAVRPVVRAGLTSPPPIGQGVVLLETTGRTSGAPRQVPLAAMRVGRRMIVSTARQDSQWVANLEADPNARVWACGSARPVRASVRRGPLNVVALDPAD